MHVLCHCEEENKYGVFLVTISAKSRLIHAQRPVIYGVVIVSRNLERTNQNDRFKMTALECKTFACLVILVETISYFHYNSISEFLSIISTQSLFCLTK